MENKIVELLRLEENRDYGTFGVLRINKEFFCCTLEPADLLNVQNVSSIPAQQYRCVKWSSVSHGITFKVKNVPGRSSILFHKGNALEHTAGCILLGQQVGKFRGDRVVLNSGKTFKRFMDIMRDEGVFHLTIREEY